MERRLIVCRPALTPTLSQRERGKNPGTLADPGRRGELI
jgi:hypothetical protein